MTIIISIDPGLDGAIVECHADGLELDLVEVSPMPCQPKLSGKGRQIDAGALAELFPVGHSDHLIALVEQSQPMPRQGVTSMYSIGRSMGVIEGILSAAGLGYETVRPAAWKRGLGLSGRPKEAAIAYVRQRYPGMDWRVSNRARMLGVADAVCIALWWVEKRSHGKRHEA